VEHLTEIIVTASGSLGLKLSPGEIAALEQHLRLLAKWNAKLNLVGPGTIESWAARHTLDSLAAAEWIQDGSAVADVGSGAGFPGIPCAIVRPASRLVLLEPRSKRAAFLQNVISAAELRNSSVRMVRAEAESERFQLVMGRAVASPLKWATLATRLCAPGGGFVLYASKEPPQSLGTAERTRIKAYNGGQGHERMVALYVPRGT
jgi:16S rRNA (guanine527-N7)-methyltransferase